MRERSSTSRQSDSTRPTPEEDPESSSGPATSSWHWDSSDNKTEFTYVESVPASQRNIAQFMRYFIRWFEVKYLVKSLEKFRIVWQ